MIYAYAYGGTVFTANIQERDETITNALYLLCVLLISLLQLFECTCRVNLVPRVDAHLLHVPCGHIGHGWIEVDIGHKGGIVTACGKSLAY